MQFERISCCCLVSSIFFTSCICFESMEDKRDQKYVKILENNVIELFFILSKTP